MSNIVRYLSPQNYLRRAMRLSNRHVLCHVESMLAPRSDEPLRHPPVFFIGAPRSGSTLAIQVITDALDVGYMSNGHDRWFGAPALAERFIHPTGERPQSDYCSDLGRTHGDYAPAESAQWWYRFFRRTPPYITLEDVNAHKMLAFRRSIAALTNAFDRSVVFKNLYASLRIQAIAHFVPESLFVITRRDEVDNAHSLLEGRYSRFDSYQPWLSVEPPSIEELRVLPPHEQVVGQIRDTLSTIEMDLERAAVPRDRRFNLVYEELCDAPLQTALSFKEFLGSHGDGAVNARSVALPQLFTRRSEVRIDSSLYSDLVNYVKDTSEFS